MIERLTRKTGNLIVAELHTAGAEERARKALNIYLDDRTIHSESAALVCLNALPEQRVDALKQITLI